MNKIPLVAAVNDMSGFGRCSLTVALPVLSAMGIQTCPLPTAILSNHTGYESCWFEEYTDKLEPYINQWRKLGLRFDGVFTGFLGSAAQAGIIADFIREFADKDAVRLIDPAMADNGKLYGTCSLELCADMRDLIAAGSITTPNLTEACLLTGADYNKISSLSGVELREAVFGLAEELAVLGPKQVIITGVHAEQGKIDNCVIDRDSRFIIQSELIDRSFAGTGDVFSSVLFGKLIQSHSLSEAVQSASDFVCKAAEYTVRLGSPSTDGIAFEPFLGELTV